MRKLCPNLDREDGLETVLEVPVPEEMFTKMGTNASVRWRNMHALMKAANAVTAATGVGGDRSSSGAGTAQNHQYLQSKSDNEFVALLKIVGSPLIPFQVPLECCLSRPINDSSIEASTAKYIVQQYVAACGGPAALNSVKNMYAVGQVKMQGSEMISGEAEATTGRPARGGSTFEVGGFVLWQKNPNLWFLELVVSGFKISAGSDGKVAWNQSSTQPSHAHRGPPRPLRRFFQGLDPRCTASLFLDAVCIEEQSVNGEDCFVLKLETPSDVLKAQCSPNTEVMHHTVWGYFSQRTGLLIKFGDTKLVRVKSVRGNNKNEGVFWETSVESVIDDYRFVDAVNIAHAGRTVTTLNRCGSGVKHRRKIEETWRIEEVDFNIRGLSLESFLPPSDIKKNQDGGDR